MNQIVVNGRFLGQHLSGVQRFAWEILRAMDAIRMAEPDHPGASLGMEILAPRGTAEPGFATMPLRRVGRLGGYAWEQLELPLAARGRVVLNLANLAPVAARKISVIHDAIVWLMPENYTRSFVLAYRLLLPLVARTSTACVTVSEHSKHALQHYGITGRVPVSVVYNGVDHILRQDQPAPTGIDWPERFVFALGNAAPNKNAALVRSLAPALRERGIATVIAGGANNAIFAGGQGEDAGVLALGRVPDAVIREGFRRAVAFLFPSFHEGFGIPPVEAMALGCPVVASNSSAMPEVLGDAAVLCSPHKPAQWLDAVNAIAGDPALRARLIERGHARAARYTWEAAARRMLTLLAANA